MAINAFSLHGKISGINWSNCICINIVIVGRRASGTVRFYLNAKDPACISKLVVKVSFSLGIT